MINEYIPPFSTNGLHILKPPYSGPPPSFSVDVPIKPTMAPIRVTRKIRGKKQSNVFVYYCGYPDQSHEFDILLHNVKGGPILRKHKNPAPPLDDIDPCFKAHYDKATHGTRLQQDLDLTHLDPPMWEGFYKLLQKYWSMLTTKVYSYPSRITNVP
jgi:hypothetical protein